MSQTAAEPVVAVHVASVADGAQLTPGGAPEFVVNCETYALTANDPVQCILPINPKRKIAFIQAIDNDIVIGTQGQCQSPNNTVASVPQPQGSYVPKANGTPVPVITTGSLYAGVTTTSSNSRVSVIDIARQ